MLDSKYWPTIQEVEFAAAVFRAGLERNDPAECGKEVATKCALSSVWAAGRMFEAMGLTPCDLGVLITSGEWK